MLSARPGAKRSGSKVSGSGKKRRVAMNDERRDEHPGAALQRVSAEFDILDRLAAINEARGGVEPHRFLDDHLEVSEPRHVGEADIAAAKRIDLGDRAVLNAGKRGEAVPEPRHRGRRRIVAREEERRRLVAGLRVAEAPCGRSVASVMMWESMSPRPSTPSA